MRGEVTPQRPLWYTIDIESLIAADHPLREVKRRADTVLAAMDREFRKAYSKRGRPSVPPEMLLKALLLQALYSIRSERRLVEEIRVNLMYRWFLDLSLDAPVWDATSFTTNRERFEKHGLVRGFFDRVVESAYLEQLASMDHFTVDGTLIDNYASMKSFRRRDAAAECAHGTYICYLLGSRRYAPDNESSIELLVVQVVLEFGSSLRDALEDTGEWARARGVGPVGNDCTAAAGETTRGCRDACRAA